MANEWTEKTSRPEVGFQEILMRYRTQNPSELLVGAREARISLFRFWERLSDRAVLHNMLREAGFKEVSSSTIQHQAVLPTIEDYCKLARTGLTASLEMAEMGPENREELLRELKQALAPMLTPPGLVLDWELNYFKASK